MPLGHYLCFLLEICVLEKIGMLEASVLAGKEANVNLESLAICIFLERRVPAPPLFTLLQHHSTISKRAEIKTNKALFHVYRFQGGSHTRTWTLNH